VTSSYGEPPHPDGTRQAADPAFRLPLAEMMLPDLGAVRQEIDEFFGRLGSLVEGGERGQPHWVSLWLAGLAGAAIEGYRRRRRRRRGAAGGGGKAGMPPFLPGPV
jgi:hypothetical protein